MATKPSDFLVVPIGFSLAKIDAASTPLSSGNKLADREEVVQLSERINTLQDILFAERRRKVLVILQGMDTSGKDGTVRRVFQRVNPLGMRVTSFKTPTAIEREHDYLWRVQAQLPGAGEMVVFNRSHYEDVLITRVHGWIDDAEAKRRFRHFNDFERLLTDTGTVILKFFLHISNAEQKRRLRERLQDGTKHWKFDPSDLSERDKWTEYMRAYEQALGATSTEVAPWHVVPADSKTHRDLVIARASVRALEDMNLQYPPPRPEYFKLKVD